MQMNKLPKNNFTVKLNSDTALVTKMLQLFLSCKDTTSTTGSRIKNFTKEFI